MSRGSDYQGMLLLGVLALAGFTFFIIKLIANLTGLPFWDVANEARVLLIPPLLFAGVWMIERLEIPLPFRLDNTWPLLLAALWIGIHTLVVMKAVQTSGTGFMGYSSDLPASWLDLPWYASNWCRWLVFGFIVTGGYLFNVWRSNDY